MDMTLDWMTSLLCRRASPPRTSSPLGCVSSGCSCCHRSLVSDCSAGRDALTLTWSSWKWKELNPDSQDDRHEGFHLFLLWYSPFFLSMSFLPGFPPSFYPSLFSSFLPLFFISSFWLWSFSFHLLFFNSCLPLTIPSFLSSILVSPYSSISLHYSHIFLERIIMFSRLYVIICSYSLIWACVQTCTQPAKCFVEKKKSRHSELFLAGLILFLWALW